ncbi:hypothetical protein SAMN05216167_114114 [Spirosoma endophyticum]|uniref:DUF2059 domain-containing protein n=2 Tax=Spirosoma endophyticum TaxID=662367 RepID=A0A1I2AWU9_9BACT|nr:hypothetical protein SAMN05216167_114114 [Spirosoma endophyticum]
MFCSFGRYKIIYMYKFLLGILISLTVSLTTHAQTKKQEDIRQLMDLMGTTSLMKQTMSLSIEQQKKVNTNLPEEFWKILDKEADYEDLFNQLIPVYDKHYTHDEIKELLAFYKSPLGQKTIKELPTIMQESSAVGRVWGEQLGRRAAEKMKQTQSAPKN